MDDKPDINEMAKAEIQKRLQSPPTTARQPAPFVAVEPVKLGRQVSREFRLEDKRNSQLEKKLRKTGIRDTKEFMKKFASWMRRNHVPYDKYVNGWVISERKENWSYPASGHTSDDVPEMSGSTTYYYFVTSRGRYMTSSINSSRSKKSKNGTSIQEMEKRLVQAIADSRGKLSWP